MQPYFHRTHIATRLTSKITRDQLPWSVHFEMKLVDTVVLTTDNDSDEPSRVGFRLEITL